MMNRVRTALLPRLVPGLILMTALLVLASLAGLVAKFRFGDPWVHGLVPMFNLDTERNVPSFFSTGLIMLCGGAMAAIGQRVEGMDRWAWQGLALVFALLAADELVSLHERITEPLRGTLHTTGLLYFAWILPYGTATLVLGLVYFRFLLRLPSSLRNRMVVAGVIYIGGAVGIEAVEGAYLERVHDVHDLTFELLASLEESMEMAGMILLLRALMAHLGRISPAKLALPSQSHTALGSMGFDDSMRPSGSV